MRYCLPVPNCGDKRLLQVAGVYIWFKSMKRAAIITRIVLLVGLAMLLTRPPRTHPQAPKFVRGPFQSAGPFTSIHYDWGARVPFAGGKVWMWGLSGTNRHCLFYDLDTGSVLGELFNGGPVFCSQDQTKLLCEGRGSLATSARQKVIGLTRKILGKTQLPQI